MAAPPTETLRDLDVAATSHRGDRIFNRGITAAAFTALLVLAGIAIFLGIAAIEAITTQGALETYGLTPLPEPVRIKTFEPLKVTVAGEN
jgi:ABC-type phosphate transport system permease subunit